jgi:hypothetical protein
MIASNQSRDDDVVINQTALKEAQYVAAGANVLRQFVGSDSEDEATTPHEGSLAEQDLDDLEQDLYVQYW